MSNGATATITAHETGTSWMLIPAGTDFDIFPGDGGVAVVTLQRRDPDNTATVYDIKDFNSTDDAEIGHAAASWDYRLYVKTSGYTSGTIAIGLWKAS